MNRQPKGTPVGGQFAEGRKPDGSDLPTDGAVDTTLSCAECGQKMVLNENDVSHHLTEDGEIDYDTDHEHVAFTEEDDNLIMDQEQVDEEPYCDYCEGYGHTFRSCPRRDDSPEERGPDLSDLSTGFYFDAEQMTIREGDIKVVEIARELGFGFTGSGSDALGTYDDETMSEIGERAVSWLNESRCPEGFYWAFEEGSFGLWEDEDDDGPDDDVSDDFPMSVEYDTSYEDGDY